MRVMRCAALEFAHRAIASAGQAKRRSNRVFFARARTPCSTSQPSRAVARRPTRRRLRDGVQEDVFEILVEHAQALRP